MAFKAFNQLHHAGTPTPHSGIYGLEYCGENVCLPTVIPLPSQNHHQHSPAAAILRRLIVATK